MKKSCFRFEIHGNIEIECRRNKEKLWNIKIINNNTGKEEIIHKDIDDNEFIAVTDFLLHKDIPKGKRKTIKFLKENIKRIQNNSSILCQNMKSTLKEQSMDMS